MRVKSKNGFTATIPMPQDTRSATFNKGAFLAGTEQTLLTTASFDVGLTTGDIQVVFSGFNVITDSGDLSIDLYGESTFTVGTDIPIYVTNKNSASLPSVTALVVDPTVSVLGVLQAPPISITGDNNAKTTTDTLVRTPMILKPNTSYIFRVTHNDTGTKTVSLLMSAFDNVIDQPTF